MCSSDLVGIKVSGVTLKSDVNIYNNTNYGYGDLAGDVGLSGAFVLGNGTLSGFGGTMEFVNNIIYNNKDLNFVYINDDAMSTITRAENNIWFNSTGTWTRVPWYATSGAPIWDDSPITTDPLFVDPANNDFRLQLGSPAIDAGSDIVGGIVKTDMLSTSRPQNDEYDIGA